MTYLTVTLLGCLTIAIGAAALTLILVPRQPRHETARGADVEVFVDAEDPAVQAAVVTILTDLGYIVLVPDDDRADSPAAGVAALAASDAERLLRGDCDPELADLLRPLEGELTTWRSKILTRRLKT